MPGDRREPRQARPPRDRALPGRPPGARAGDATLRPRPLRPTVRLRPRPPRTPAREPTDRRRRPGVGDREPRAGAGGPRARAANNPHVRLRAAYSVRQMMTAIYPGTYD